MYNVYYYNNNSIQYTTIIMFIKLDTYSKKYLFKVIHIHTLRENLPCILQELKCLKFGCCLKFIAITLLTVFIILHVCNDVHVPNMFSLKQSGDLIDFNV